jgi:CRAL/TRIO domain
MGGESTFRRLKLAGSFSRNVCRQLDGLFWGAFFIVAFFPALCRGLVTERPVSKLLQDHAADIAKLEEIAGPDAVEDKLFYLRYCVEAESPQDLTDRFEESLAWRRGAGKPICTAAKAAVAEAMKDGGWNNAAVSIAAPSAATIQQYITPSQVLTTTLRNGDLVYCIRAGLIRDNELLKEVSVDQLVNFFLYVKEVLNIVANMRSLETDRLVCVITANDLTSVPLIGGSADFRQALSQSSKLANQLYPSLAGPTLLLNLPKVLMALVKLFTPLFPPAVNKRLKFADAPSLARVDSLVDIAVGGSQRGDFEAEIQSILSR